jgi:Na+/H+ antiporter NhaB
MCPACGLRFEKEEGGFLGAMVLNYALAIGLWVVVLAVVLAFTVPDVPVGWLLVASAIVLIGVPLWFYPRSKTTWAAVEYLVARSDPDYGEPMTGVPDRELPK